MTTIQCERCDQESPALEKPPFQNERGAAILNRICKVCWGEWLQHQTLLINHYGLDPRDRKSRDFLYSQVDEVLLGGGKANPVDTSKEGTIEW